MAIARGQAARGAFAESGSVSPRDEPAEPRAVGDHAPVLAGSFDLGQVGEQSVSRHLILAYDDFYSIKYFRSRLRPYWRRAGADAADMLRTAARQYPVLAERCRRFDEELMADLARVGGERYALVCALAYRQTLAGNKIAADPSGMPLVFPKENFSNGCISTVDVLFPQAPFFLTFSPALTKAILGIGGYAQLCQAVGRRDEATKYMAIARQYAAKWEELAKDDGRTRLAYHLPGTWGMKHNLIWDRVLGLNLFPDRVGDAEIAWYRKVQNKYGLPVDNRTPTSLIDWAVWSIAPARNPSDFEALFEPVFRYANETPSRVPLSDWYVTTDGRQQGFQARPVVGGIFVRLLSDAGAWKKWSQRAERVLGPWAESPIAGYRPPAATFSDRPLHLWRLRSQRRRRRARTAS